MKITIILGSPKKKGNTAAMLELFEKEISENHEVNRINIREKKIGGCLGCYKCRGKESFDCAQKDDAVSIFEQMLDSDLTIYATPLYCWDFSAQMKTFIDRHVCAVKEFGLPDKHKSLLEGKKIALLVTCAGPIEDNADVIQTVFDRVSFYTKTKVAGKYILPFCTTPDAVSKQGVELAKKMAKELIYQ